MAAPQIPNLLSLRGRSGRRGGHGGLGDHGDSEGSKKQQDLIVQATDTDANISRLSAVQAGYLEDAFALDFAPPSPPGGFRRLPIINRGTYMRTTAIDLLVKNFLAEFQERKQIISLGAGTDTRFFRFADAGILGNCLWHEFDFSENTKKKVSVIQRSSRMKLLLGEDVDFLEDEIRSLRYHLHAIDLRQLNPSHPQYPSRPSLTQIDPKLPTLILSECCLVYLTPEAADAVVNFFTTRMLDNQTPRGIILYEPINPYDAFGKVMVSNLASRGIVLQTLNKYGSSEAQRERLKTYGFSDGQNIADIAWLSEHWVGEEEKDRLSGVEMLDEVEELNMLMKHYCIVWGWCDGGGKDVWGKWREMTSQR